MELDIAILRKRLDETFGSDSQATVAEKIGREQGTVSKLLSFSQNKAPRPETLFNIAKAYNVSVDWLLGLSEQKQIDESAKPISYASAVKNLVSLCQHQAKAIIDESGTGLVLKFDDPIIKFLVKKSLGLSALGIELYQHWVETSLAKFEDKPLIFSDIWSYEGVLYDIIEAATESDWLRIHAAAMELEEHCAEEYKLCEDAESCEQIVSSEKQRKRHKE